MEMTARPNFFIVGAAKCGTTALYAYLREHPQVFMPSLKEPGFFAADIMGDRRPIVAMPDYLKLFASAGNKPRIGEASTSYLLSKDAPGLIKTFSSSARIIIILRNPVDKIYARFNEGRLGRQETHSSFAAALKDEAENGPSFGVGYIESGKYSSKVQRYFEIFGRENVHVTLYDDLLHSRSQVYEGILQFLGLPRDQRNVFPIMNANHRVRSFAVQGLMNRPPRLLRRAVLASTPPTLRHSLRALMQKINLVYEPRPAMDPKLRAQLRHRFQEDVTALGLLLGRDLSHWVNPE